MDIAHFKKLSPEEKLEYIFESITLLQGDVHSLQGDVHSNGNMLVNLTGRMTPLETKVQELTDNVDTNSAAVTGLATRMDDFEERLTKVVVPDVEGDIKTENVTVVD